MKTQKKASPGNGKNNKVKNNRKQSGHSGRFAKSLLLTEGLLIVLAVMVLMGIRLWQKSNPASAASAMLQDKPDGLNLVHASAPDLQKLLRKIARTALGILPKGCSRKLLLPTALSLLRPPITYRLQRSILMGLHLTDPLSYKPDQEISVWKRQRIYRCRWHCYFPG